ncbi:hypothetical protein VNO77_19330 [Canavalia gladiata]|uniref:Uncharacterized protein n=1 Tax=Canavalia gladiata TaxID=3824 RepID=A0AAN9QPI0_CANGL
MWSETMALPLRRCPPHKRILSSLQCSDGSTRILSSLQCPNGSRRIPASLLLDSALSSFLALAMGTWGACGGASAGHVRGAIVHVSVAIIGLCKYSSTIAQARDFKEGHEATVALFDPKFIDSKWKSLNSP